ncbi:unnamed protein product, partial [Didymodactylos carnosus]
NQRRNTLIDKLIQLSKIFFQYIIWLNCLRNIKPKIIVNYTLNNDKFFPVYSNTSKWDNFIPSMSLPNIFKTGNLNKNIDLLIGTVKDEGIILFKKSI